MNVMYVDGTAHGHNCCICKSYANTLYGHRYIHALRMLQLKAHVRAIECTTSAGLGDGDILSVYPNSTLLHLALRTVYISPIPLHSQLATTVTLKLPAKVPEAYIMQCDNDPVCAWGSVCQR